MKKLFLLLIIFICNFVLFTNKINVKASNLYDLIHLENYILDNECKNISNEFEVYGNIGNLSRDDFMKIVENGTDKIYMNYRTNYTIDLPYDLLVVIKTNGKYHQYEYKVEEPDETYLKEGIIAYLKLNIHDICQDYYTDLNEFNNTVSTYSTVPSTFIDSVANANFTLDFPKKGYIVSRIAVSEYRATNKSAIFIVKVMSSFVPGIVAKANGLNYDKWRNDNGYVHISVEQAMDRNEEYYYGTRYGATPYFKDYWPVNQPTTVTIGSSIDTGLVLGYSQKDGFSVDANLISYGYSKSITYSNPRVSAQMHPNLKEAQWSYTFEDNYPDTYDQEANYMYEISRSGKDMLYGDVRLKIDYKFVVDRAGFYTQQTKYSSLDLMVRTSDSRIYDFCNGMI